MWSVSLGYAPLKRVVEFAQSVFCATPGSHFRLQNAVGLLDVAPLPVQFSKDRNLRAGNGRIYGFEQIVHRATIAPEDLLILIVIGGQKDDRHSGGVLALLDQESQLEPCHAWHADIENEDSKFILKERKCPGSPRARSGFSVRRRRSEC